MGRGGVGMDFISKKVEAPEAVETAGKNGREFSQEAQDKFDRLFGEDKPNQPDGAEVKISHSSFKGREEKFDRMFGDDKLDKPDIPGGKPLALEWKEGGEVSAGSDISGGKSLAPEWKDGGEVYAGSDISGGKPPASEWKEGGEASAGSDISGEKPPALEWKEEGNKFERLFAGDDLNKESDGAEQAGGSSALSESDSTGGDSPESASDGNDSPEKKELTEEEKQQKIQDFLDGKIDFEEVKEIFAEYYADAVNSNHPWSWGDTIPGGDELTGGQRKAIREYAREKGMVPTVPTYEKDGKTYADFSEHQVFECVLNKEDWPKTDKEQFDKCNEMLKKAIEENPELAKQFTKEQLEQINRGETPSGYTWHHSEKDGVMQLVPYGVHNSTNHHGGRSEGNWADAPRQ